MRQEGPRLLQGQLLLEDVEDRAGTVVYSTSNSKGIGKNLDVGIFDADQTRLLAQQKIDVADGALIVGTNTDDVLVVVRLAPPQPAVRFRLEQMLAKINCGNMPVS